MNIILGVDADMKMVGMFLFFHPCTVPGLVSTSWGKQTCSDEAEC
jgi:hypothetical protein